MSQDLMRYAVKMDLSKMGAIMPRRMAHIAQGAPVPPKLDYAANRTAAALHPACQKLRVTEVLEREAGARSFVLCAADGGELARFNAGQFDNNPSENAGYLRIYPEGCYVPHCGKNRHNSRESNGSCDLLLTIQTETGRQIPDYALSGYRLSCQRLRKNCRGNNKRARNIRRRNNRGRPFFT